MSLIPQNFIDDLLDRTDIVEVIDSRVKLKKSGKNYLACCPFHKEKTPSFSVSPDKQFYYCFGCGASGTAITFLLEYEHLGFVDAVETLARNAGLTVPRESSKSQQAAQTHKSLYELLARAAQWYEKQLKEHPGRNQAVDYLKSRGLTGAVCKAFAVGYAPPGWDNLLMKLGLTEHDRSQLLEGGLLIQNEESGRVYDRFRERIMFPILDTRGRTIGFGGRVLSSDTKGPKYLNSPETPVFRKGRELYGLYQARQQAGQLENLLVVEGYMDVIALAQFGIHNAVATLGTACGEEHLKLAFRYTSEVVFCFDGDNAGRKAARRALENALPAMTDGRQVKFLFLPEGQDPDSLVRQIGPERFSATVASAVALEDFFFEAVGEGIDVRSMEGRARMSKLAAPLLHKLPPGVYRELMFDSLARHTGLTRETLTELMGVPAKPLEPAAPAQPEQPQAEPPPVFEHSHFTPRPAPEPAPRVRTRLSPARLATLLLLDKPALITEFEQWQAPEGVSDQDLTSLTRLVEFLRSRPHTTFPGILGYWMGHYGQQALDQLTGLAAPEFLGSAHRSAPYDSAAELKDALWRISQQYQLQQYQRELAELATLSTLSDEQKARMRELLQLQTRARQKPQA